MKLKKPHFDPVTGWLTEEEFEKAKSLAGKQRKQYIEAVEMRQKKELSKYNRQEILNRKLDDTKRDS